MDRVFPLEHTATLILGGEYITTKCISEIGIFGGVLVDKDGNAVWNAELGNMM